MACPEKKKQYTNCGKGGTDHQNFWEILSQLIVMLSCTALISGCNIIQDFVCIDRTLENIVVRPGDDVALRCTTSNSSLQAWMSNEFIGVGGNRLEFFYDPNSSSSRLVDTSPYANVTLLNSTNKTGVIFLESLLSIIMQTNAWEMVISCLNINKGVNESITLKVSLDPDLEMSKETLQVCPGETITMTCNTRGTETHTWIIYHVSTEQGDPIIVTVTSKIGMSWNNSGNVTVELIDSYIKNGYRVLTSTLNITIPPSMQNENLSVTCRNVARDTNTTTILEMGGPGYCEANEGVTQAPNEVVTQPSNASNTTSSRGFSCTSARFVMSMMIISFFMSL